RKRNREGKPIQYRDVLAPLQEQTGKRVSLRTVQRVGKENADVNSKPTINKTKWECKNHIHITLLHSLISIPSKSAHFTLSLFSRVFQCRLSCVMISQI